MVASSSPVFAANFTWNSAASANWSTPGAWANGSAPTSTDSIASPTQTGAAILSAGTTTVANFTASYANSLDPWSITTAPGTASLLTITGALSKSGNGSLIFSSTNATSPLSLSLGSLSISAGSVSFGETAAAKSLEALTVSGLTTISGGTLNLHLASGGTAFFGAVNMTGGTWNIRNTTSANSATVRVQGLSGSAGLIRNAGSGGSSANQQGIILIETTGATTFSGTIIDNSNANANNVVVRIAGTGTQTFTSANTYSGGTTVTAGTFLVNNTTGSGVGTGAVTVQAGGTFGGDGIVVLGANQAVDITGSLLVGTTSSPETFEISTTGTGFLGFRSGSVVLIDIWSNSLNGADKLITLGATTIDSGSTLSLTNAGAVTFALNDQFDLFDWGQTPTGSFSSFILPTLGSGLSWDTSTLYTTGVITVVPEPGTWAMFGLGLAFLFFRARRRSA